MEKDSEFDDFIQSKPPVFRSKYPQDNDDRIQILKSYYEKRLENLKEDIKLVFQKIVSDDLVRTMKEDPTSLEFVNQRVREIFEEVISNDREIILEKIYKQYSFLKSEFKKLEEEKQKVNFFLKKI